MKKAACALALLLPITTTFGMEKDTSRTLQRFIPACTDVIENDNDVSCSDSEVADICIGCIAGAGAAAGGAPIFGPAAIPAIWTFVTCMAWGVMTIPNSAEQIKQFQQKEKND